MAVLTSHRWALKAGVLSILGSKTDTKYKISVFTGDKAGAGTDSNVYIILFGENGDSWEKYLDNKKNNFERNKTDTFVVKSLCLGRLDRIRIGHDNSGFGPRWFLEKLNKNKDEQEFILIKSLNFNFSAPTELQALGIQRGVCPNISKIDLFNGSDYLA